MEEGCPKEQERASSSTPTEGSLGLALHVSQGEPLQRPPAPLPPRPVNLPNLRREHWSPAHLSVLFTQETCVELKQPEPRVVLGRYALMWDGGEAFRKQNDCRESRGIPFRSQVSLPLTEQMS